MSSWNLRVRFRRYGAVLVCAALVSGLTLSLPSDATAAMTVTCTPEQSVFGVHTNGTLYHHPFYDLSTASTPISGARTSVGTGWQTYGRVMGGPGGRIYGLKTGGLYEYRWAGTGFAGPPRNITATFNGFVSGANRTRITVDGSGAVYAITGPNLDQLYRYVIDPVQGKISDTQLMDDRWNQYTMIVAAGNGVIYSRDAAGILYRTQFDPGSHRLVEATKQVGSGWNQFSQITSVGADILLAMQPDGDLFQYRYDESTRGWPIVGRPVGAGWNQFTDLPAIVDDCKSNISHAPAPIARQPTPGAAVAVRPNPDGVRIDYAYVDSNTGEVKWGHQRDANVFDTNGIVWPAPPLTTERHVGTPTLTTFGASQAAIVAQSASGRYWSAFQPSAATETLSGWRAEGGTMVGDISVLSDSYPGMIPAPGTTPIASLHAVDAAGSLWRSMRDAPTFLSSWEKVLTGRSLVGSPVTSPWENNMALTVALTEGGGLIGWTSGRPSDLPQPPQVFDIGGSNLTGDIAMVGDGGDSQIYVRDVNGTIQSISVGWGKGGAQVNLGPWSPVGDGGVKMVGKPSAARLPNGSYGIAARGEDGRVYVSYHWTGDLPSPWRLVSSLPLAGDPTVFSYKNSAGSAWGIVSYTQDYQVYFFDLPPTPPSKTRAAADEEFRARLIKR